MKIIKIKKRVIIQKYWEKLNSERFLIIQLLSSILGIIIGIIVYDMHNIALSYGYIGAFDLFVISLGALLMGFMNLYSFINSILDKKYSKNILKKKFAQECWGAIIKWNSFLILSLFCFFSPLSNDLYGSLNTLISQTVFMISHVEISFLDFKSFRIFMIIIWIIGSVSGIILEINFFYYIYKLELLKNIKYKRK